MGFDPVRGVGTGCWPGMQRLAAYLFDRFGGGDLGCFNPASVAGGGPSLHAEGRAQDFAFNANDPRERAAGDVLFRWAVEHADEIGLQEMLWRGAIWFYERRLTEHGWGDFQLEGVYGPVQQADHMSHVHLGVDRNAGMNWQPGWIKPELSKEDRMKPGLFVDSSNVVWVYDPNNHTKTRVDGPATLSAIQALRQLEGLPTTPMRNGTTDAVLAGAVELS